MITQRTARLIAAVAAPVFMLQAQPAHCRAARPDSTGVAASLPHISIVAMGKGSPVVLIPGLSSPREVWAGVAPQIARNHRVLLVQVNGFGGDAPGANLQPGLLDGIVADLHGYLVAQKLAQAEVIGHSMGGLVALMLAKAHPADVSKLMVVDTLPFIGDIFVPNATVAMLAPQAVALRDQMAAQYGKAADPAANAAIGARLALTPAAQSQVAAWSAKADPRVSGQAMYEDMSTDLRPDMAAIAAPITLVYPWSEALPKARADALYHAAYARAPHVAFIDVGDSGHFVMLDQPAAFSAAVEGFVQ